MASMLPRRKVALLTVVAVGCGLLALACLVYAVWCAVTARPVPRVGWLPEGSPTTFPPRAVVLAAVAGCVGHLFALAAAHARVSMQILARDRRIPPDVPAEIKRLRSEVLGRHSGEDSPRPSDDYLVGAALPPRSPSADARNPVRVTVLIPAHNEELILPAALASLQAQVRRPDRVVVISDNSTDATVEVARGWGVEVIETEGNTEKKAGALNQVLASWLPGTGPNDVVMVMDADTALVPEFLSTAVARLEADPDLIAVGGVFFGEEGGGLIGQLQRNEFARYQRYIARRKGKVFVLTGTASLIRAFALSAVAEARGTLIPGPPGKVYDTFALTEDNELTLALKSLGAKLVSPMQCRCITELMPTWRALWRQRSRWQRGALENVGAFGLTRTTAPYWGQQLGIGYGVLAFNAYLLLMLVTLLAADSFEMVWFWTIIGLIFVAERIVTVWSVGWRGRLVALPLVIELVYAEFLMVVYLKSLFDIALGRSSGWNTVQREKVQL